MKQTVLTPFEVASMKDAVRSPVDARQRAASMNPAKSGSCTVKLLRVWKTRVFSARSNAANARKVKQSKGWRLVVMIRENARARAQYIWR